MKNPLVFIFGLIVVWLVYKLESRVMESNTLRAQLAQAQADAEDAGLSLEGDINMPPVSISVRAPSVVTLESNDPDYWNSINLELRLCGEMHPGKRVRLGCDTRSPFVEKQADGGWELKNGTP